MNEIGLFVSTFGGAGLFIFYLINKDKTTNKEQTEAIKGVGRKLDRFGESFDDFSFLLLDLLDNLIPSYGKKRNVQTLKDRITERQYARDREDQNNNDL